MTKLRAEIIRLGKDAAYTRAFRLMRALIYSMFLAIAAPIIYRGSAFCALAAFVNGTGCLLFAYFFFGMFGKPEQGEDSAIPPDQEKGSPPENSTSG